MILMLDKMRIRQILLNLISNAIKFSSMYDRVDVFVNCKVENFETVNVQIKVVDYGIGISPKDMQNLF
jgi:signal transduction histidine kinase